MYYLRIKGHSFKKEIKEMIAQYFNEKDIRTLDSIKAHYSHQDYLITSGMKEQEDYCILFTQVVKRGKEISKKQIKIYNFEYNNQKMKNTLIKKNLKITLYYTMENVFNKTLPWGILMGIRPTKIVHRLIEEGKTDDEIIFALKSDYLITDQKSLLLVEVAKQERNIIYPTDINKISLYIGIPFCPSRCTYCSFISSVLGKDRSVLKKYLKALHFEIQTIAKYIDEKNLNIESIYIGGGTPTILDSVELKELLSTINKNINMHSVKEYTLEAGRPDTITEDKLKISLHYGVDRISINPQTMNQNTLINIGRMHSPEDIIESYQLAKKIGIPIINMDLILGLPGEKANNVKETLEQIRLLQPENLTVHIMSVKRGSKLKEEMENGQYNLEQDIFKMLELSQEFAVQNAYNPYYLYRQKYMTGNLENVGYCKKDYKSTYNIQMIAEKQTIIGLGAGAITKIVFPDEGKIVRNPNVKDIQQYIQRIQELVKRKIILLNNLFDNY